jgi:preprotein translocase subunit YajC
MIFETTAHAAPAGGFGLGGDGWLNILFLGGFVLIFYFLLIRPQNKRRKEHQSLVGGLSKGDEIVTAGGIVGQINKVEDDFIKVQVSKDVEMRIQKSAIGATLPKGTIQSLEDS